MNQSEYEAKEARDFRAALLVPGKTRQERQEARAEWLKDMQTNPALIGERVGWLLNGSYGFGSYQAARAVIQNKRLNVSAWCGVTIAALEWGCDSRAARAAWNLLTDAQRDAVTAAITAAVESALEDLAEEAAYQAGKI